MDRYGRLDDHRSGLDSGGITSKVFDAVGNRVGTDAVRVDRIDDNDSVADVAIDIVSRRGTAIDVGSPLSNVDRCRTDQYDLRRYAVR